jgi:hypothetical protein
MSSILLSTAYFPPLTYFMTILSADTVLIEMFENYQKQSYRTRCHIYGANGKQTLSIPVIKGPDLKTPITQIKIDYSENWQVNHLKSIESAYSSSPFLEYYIDEFRFIFENKWEYLTELNHQILVTCLEAMQIEVKVEVTSDFIDPSAKAYLDYRYNIHPKMAVPDDLPELKEYVQVFGEKHGFIPNLSILDLIFNEGPNAESFLMKNF